MIDICRFSDLRHKSNIRDNKYLACKHMVRAKPDSTKLLERVALKYKTLNSVYDDIHEFRNRIVDKFT